VFPLPANVPTCTAAAAMLQGMTALALTTESYAVRPGDTALVHTVAGGLGLALAQCIKRAGARVIGTTSTQEKARVARAAGADEVILYKEEDVVSRVLEITAGEGVDVIYDGVGKDTFENDFKMVKRKGTLVSVGNASGPIPPFSLFKLSDDNIKLVRPSMRNYLATRAENLHYTSMLFDLLAKDELKIKIHAEYEFTPEGVARAHTDLVEGKTVGKLVIKVADE
jgi:NADPH:quinone reductase-like Zn-dependent oxidoreductase